MTSQGLSQRYVFSLTFAALAFGTARFFDPLIRYYLNTGRMGIRWSAALVLATLSFVDMAAFTIGGLVAWYTLRRLITPVLPLMNLDRLGMCLFLGIAVGVFFIPAPAAILFLLFRAPDLPSYFDRCLEFAAPMIAAGAAGGAAFWSSGSERSNSGGG